MGMEFGGFSGVEAKTSIIQHCGSYFTGIFNTN